MSSNNITQHSFPRIWIVIFSLVLLRIFSLLKPIPTYANYFFQQGYTYQHNNNDELAIKTYKKAIRHNQNATSSYYQLGLLAEKQQNPDSALNYYMTVTQQIGWSRQYLRAFFYVGRDYFYKEDYNNAVRYLRTGIISSHDVQSLYYLGMAAYHLGDTDSLIKYSRTMQHYTGGSPQLTELKQLINNSTQENN